MEMFVTEDVSEVQRTEGIDPEMQFPFIDDKKK
jgi:hypothetical protein